MSDKKVRKEPQNIELSQTIIDSFARFLVPEIRKYYESEQGRREFEAWEEKREQEEDNK